MNKEDLTKNMRERSPLRRQSITPSDTIGGRPVDNINPVNNVNKGNNVAGVYKKKSDKKLVTAGKIRQSYYIDEDLLKQLESYKYWDRLTITEAFNNVVRDGLKDKKTDPVESK